MSLELAVQENRRDAETQRECVTSSQFSPVVDKRRNAKGAQAEGRQEPSSFRPSAARAGIQAGFPLSRE